MKNIIFLTHAEKKPSGGAKYIYRFSQIINDIKNFSSEVIHIKKKKLSKFKNSLNKKLNFKKNVYSGWQFKDITSLKILNMIGFIIKLKLKENFEFDKKKILLFYQKFLLILLMNF